MHLFATQPARPELANPAKWVNIPDGGLSLKLHLPDASALDDFAKTIAAIMGAATAAQK